ncbi:MAG: nucleoside deaminase [Bacteroidales bacterium]
MLDDAYFMNEAIKEAHKAFDKAEVPIGAVVVYQNKIIARAHNLTETLNDVTAHAEMQAITAAANALGGKYLHECTLYVTIEPCPMCASACYWAQMGTVVYGASDEKMGAESKKLSLFHPKTVIRKGVSADISAQLMKLFFKNKR